jgi:hypothetical protein
VFNGDQVCTLTRKTLAELHANGSQIAAVRDARGQWQPYDFNALQKWWTKRGMHPVEDTPMRQEAIHRIRDLLGD